MKNIVIELGCTATIKVEECNSSDLLSILGTVDRYISQDTSVRLAEVEASSEVNNPSKSEETLRGIVSILNYVPKDEHNHDGCNCGKVAIDEECDSKEESDNSEKEESPELLDEDNSEKVDIPKVQKGDTTRRVDNLFKGFKKNGEEKNIMPDRYLLFNNCEKCGQVFGVITDYPYAQCKCGNELFHDAELVRGDLKCNCGKHLNFYAPKDIGKIKCGSCKVEIDVIVEDGIVLRKKR